MAHRTGNTITIAVARIVVIADFIFTATIVVLQPVTGVWLAYESGYSLTERWILLSIALYILTGVFWLPVVWMSFGFPAFTAVLAIFWLMISRPALIF